MYFQYEKLDPLQGIDTETAGIDCQPTGEQTTCDAFFALAIALENT